jgi:formylglycine-generating enzyme required for sulfatase activity
MKKQLNILITTTLLFTSLGAYEIIIDKTLYQTTENKYTYPPLQRDDNKQIVYDPSAKLQWQDNTEAKTIQRDWEGAKAYCRNLSFAGFDDWHLPTIKELESIADYSKYPNAYKKGFQNITSSFYWSASPVLSVSSDAWRVDFKYGHSYNNYKTGKSYVRCARAGQ